MACSLVAYFSISMLSRRVFIFSALDGRKGEGKTLAKTGADKLSNEERTLIQLPSAKSVCFLPDMVFGNNCVNK